MEKNEPMTLLEERNKLAAFALEILAYAGLSHDQVRDVAEKHGLLRKEPDAPVWHFTDLLRERAEPHPDALNEGWIPINEMHEDHGTCVLIDLDDPGYLELAHVSDEDFQEAKENFTHCLPIRLSTETAERLKLAMQVASPAAGEKEQPK